MNVGRSLVGLLNHVLVILKPWASAKSRTRSLSALRSPYPKPPCTELNLSFASNMSVEVTAHDDGLFAIHTLVNEVVESLFLVSWATGLRCVHRDYHMDGFCDYHLRRHYMFCKPSDLRHFIRKVVANNNAHTVYSFLVSARSKQLVSVADLSSRGLSPLGLLQTGNTHLPSTELPGHLARLTS